jgi:hypothetical protein
MVVEEAGATDKPITRGILIRQSSSCLSYSQVPRESWNQNGRPQKERANNRTSFPHVHLPSRNYPIVTMS